MTENARRILIVEDDTSIGLGLRMNLEREGYRVQLAEDGELALHRIRDENWDLIILDVMLPKLNGYEILMAMAQERIATPVLVLSARTEDKDKVTGLDLGAEDYVTKPFSVSELLARVRVALRRRRTANRSHQLFRFGDVTVDIHTREVKKNDTPVELTLTEFNVLQALVLSRGRTMTRQQIFEAVWGKDHHGTQRTIDNFVAQLRSKLEDNPAAPAHLVTIRGIGYRLAP
ncbi:MAG TPA: response regulator transcription factor [Polyangiaceae bacterium]|nr:response regulator transcription factor [Polyangiaceae bacterium]